MMNEMVPGIHGSCVDGDTLWFSMSQANGLCRLHLDTGVVEYVRLFDSEPTTQNYLFSDILKYKSKLVFTPMNAMHIAVYDIDSEELKMIPLSVSSVRNQTDFEKWSAFYTSAILDHYIYMIPFRFPGVLRMDLDTYEIEYDDVFMDDIYPDYDKDKVFFREDIAIDDSVNRAFAVSAYYGGIMEFGPGLKNAYFRSKASPREKTGASCIQRIASGYVILKKNMNSIIVYDNDWNMVKEILPPETVSSENAGTYIGSICIGEFVYFIPYSAPDVLRLNVNTFELEMPVTFDSDSIPMYTRFWNYNGNLYCYGGDSIDTYDLNNMNRNRYSIIVDDSFWKCYLDGSKNRDGVIIESEMININHLLQGIM